MNVTCCKHVLLKYNFRPKSKNLPPLCRLVLNLSNAQKLMNYNGEKRVVIATLITLATNLPPVQLFITHLPFSLLFLFIKTKNNFVEYDVCLWNMMYAI